MNFFETFPESSLLSTVSKKEIKTIGHHSRLRDMMAQSYPILVQSLNSPFFPPHIGAQPGRAKEESRITCMRMLRANQSKLLGPNHATRVHVSRNAFFSSRSERKHFL